MFDPLKRFFSTADSCPVAISAFFENSASLFWLNFIENQLDLSNESILRVESSKGTCFEIAGEINVLKTKMKNRKSLNFIPRKAKEELKNLNDEDQQTVLKYAKNFYDTVVTYLELWSSSMDGTECFAWCSLFEKPKWEEVQSSFNYAVEKVGKMVEDKINGEFCCVC